MPQQRWVVKRGVALSLHAAEVMRGRPHAISDTMLSA
jgi:hypothetical protein